MTEQQKIVIAIDPGFDTTKIVINGKLIKVPCNVVDNTGSEGKFIAAKEEGYILSHYIQGKSHLVGDYARKLLFEKKQQKVLDIKHQILSDYERFTTADFEIGFMTAIGYALIRYCQETQEEASYNPKYYIDELENYKICVAIALPNDVIEMKEKGPTSQILQKIAKEHSFSVELPEGTYDLKFKIERTNKCRLVQSQVVAALLGTIYDETNKEMKIIDSRLLPIFVIDGGYKTVGMFKLSRINTVEEDESNSDFAMSKIDEATAKNIQDTYGRYDIKDYNIEEMISGHEDLVVNDGTGNTQFQSIEALRQEQIKSFCNLMIDYINEKHNGLLDIRQVLFTGGTGAAYYEYFKKWAAKHKNHLNGRIVLAEYDFLGQKVEPVYSIVVGLYKQFSIYLSMNEQ